MSGAYLYKKIIRILFFLCENYVGCFDSKDFPFFLFNKRKKNKMFEEFSVSFGINTQS